MEDQIADYLGQILPKKEDWVLELEEQAIKNNVPIMDTVGIHFVMQLVRIKQPKRILEVGTAIGYSALRMLEASPNTSIVTIERDETRYQQAINNINKLEKTNQIEVIYGDALDILEKLQEENQNFDFIFIDAAKGQYRRFFDLCSPLLTNNGMILTDNVLFRGYVMTDSQEIPKRYRKMVEKIKLYNQFLMNHPAFTTSIIPIGDGVALSYKT
ncbi:O-methyltransferase [Oceanobacillus halophilus]|uniref:tRNA 5-hydroxyuridine methyltransferase n=1 Tax=Oceanobacillus halophilus TaxID=930130 RepID=A0A495AD17_9BACI|nr:O-methyltransferase [Oceanobacillus halophilus]RKQ37867.1 O-methyltransferase [Oceanobacillus halophilus]